MYIDRNKWTYWNIVVAQDVYIVSKYPNINFSLVTKGNRITLWQRRIYMCGKDITVAVVDC